MKPSNMRRSTQLRLELDADESLIWATVNGVQQRRVVEHLTKLWIEYVITSHEPASDPTSSKHPCEKQESNPS